MMVVDYRRSHHVPAHLIPCDKRMRGKQHRRSKDGPRPLATVVREGQLVRFQTAMNIVQASFQASFDARVQHLGESQLTDLRTLFRYFDTDGNGVVAAGQACRMFSLLGLDVNRAQVEELGEVYLAEFIKIVDSHTTPPPQHIPQPMSQQSDKPFVETSESKPVDNSTTSNANETQDNKVVQAEGGADDKPTVDMSPEAVLERSKHVWELEWKLIDTYGRGHVSPEDIRLFIASCGAALRPNDLQRFFECFGEPASPDMDDDVLVLSKAGFLKFRYDYTAKDLFQPDEDESDPSDSEHEREEVEFLIENPEEQPSETDPDADVGPKMHSRPASARASTRGREDVHEHQLAVDPSMFHESEYESDNDDAVDQDNPGAAGSAMGLDPLMLDD